MWGVLAIDAWTCRPWERVAPDQLPWPSWDFVVATQKPLGQELPWPRIAWPRWVEVPWPRIAWLGRPADVPVPTVQPRLPTRWEPPRPPPPPPGYKGTIRYRRADHAERLPPPPPRGRRT